MRLAWAADVAGVAALQLRALRDRIPAGLAADIEVADVEQAWRAAVTRPPTARHRLVVATEDSGVPVAAGADRPGPPVVAPADLGTTGSGHVVGFVATGPAEDPDAEPGIDGEVLVLHVAVPDEELLGALLAAGADTLEADGFTRAQVWVAADDDPLRRVADAAGWVPDGAHRRLASDAAGADDLELAQIRLHTGLGPATTPTP